jgi:hypothetical protein
LGYRLHLVFAIRLFGLISLRSDPGTAAGPVEERAVDSKLCCKCSMSRPGHFSVVRWADKARQLTVENETSASRNIETARSLSWRLSEASIWTRANTAGTG